MRIFLRVCYDMKVEESGPSLNGTKVFFFFKHVSVQRKMVPEEMTVSQLEHFWCHKNRLPSSRLD